MNAIGKAALPGGLERTQLNSWEVQAKQIPLRTMNSAVQARPTGI
jgi:hypothetical protein